MSARSDRRVDPSRAFLGVGWAFPLRLAADRSFATAAHEEDVRESIQIILGTRRNERLMRPDFGAGLEDFVFEPISTTTREALRRQMDRGGFYTGYDANRQASSFLGVTLENLGLDDWGRYYADRGADPGYRPRPLLSDRGAAGRPR